VVISKYKEVATWKGYCPHFRKAKEEYNNNTNLFCFSCGKIAIFNSNNGYFSSANDVTSSVGFKVM
jgi:hypothetical protein